MTPTKYIVLLLYLASEVFYNQHGIMRGIEGINRRPAYPGRPSCDRGL